MACQDGTIRILKIKKRKIELIKILCKDSQQCLSLEVVARATQNRPLKEVKKALRGSSEEESSDEEEVYESSVPVEYVYGGYADGSIKKWNLTTGNCD